VADGREPELGGRRLMGPALPLDPGGDVQRPHLAEGSNAGRFAPVEKIFHRGEVGAPGMGVTEIGGEEFEEALAGVVIGGHDDGRQRPYFGSERYQMSHALPSV
jgi:hypothetical protein